jgi:hypothetical protein
LSETGGLISPVIVSAERQLPIEADFADCAGSADL